MLVPPLLSAAVPVPVLASVLVLLLVLLLALVLVLVLVLVPVLVPVPDHQRATPAAGAANFKNDEPLPRVVVSDPTARSSH